MNQYGKPFLSAEWRYLAMVNYETDSASHFVEGSEEECIAQHYWGYSKQKDSGTMEYRVDHPVWRIWPARSSPRFCAVTHLQHFSPKVPRLRFIAA